MEVNHNNKPQNNSPPQQQNVTAKKNPFQRIKGRMPPTNVKTLAKVACVGAVFAIAMIAANKLYNPPSPGLKTLCIIKGPKATTAANTEDECSLAEESIKNGKFFEGIETIRRSAATSLACERAWKIRGLYSLPLANQPEFQAQPQDIRFTPKPSIEGDRNPCIEDIEHAITRSCKEYEGRQQHQNFLTKRFQNLFESCESTTFKDKDGNDFTFTTKRLI
jgi:hypothetical protein